MGQQDGVHTRGNTAQPYKGDVTLRPATRKEGAMITLSEVRKTKKDKYHMISLRVDSKHGYK